jgi:hypothetical protein
VHAGDAICHGGPRGEEGDADAAVDVAVALGHHHCRLLVADADRPHAEVAAVADSLDDRPPDDGKDVIDALGHERPRHQLAAFDFCHLLPSC